MHCHLNKQLKNKSQALIKQTEIHFFLNFPKFGILVYI